MAKKKNRKRRREQIAGSRSAAATVEAPPRNEAEIDAEIAGGTGDSDFDGGTGHGGGGGDSFDSGGASESSEGGRDRPTVAARRGSFFEVYKRGQGYYTRMGTAIGAAVMILAGANYLYDQLGGVLASDSPIRIYLQVGVPLTLAAVLGVLTYWLVGVNRRSCDFMIATEGEMKKVSWSSRRAVIGSTKVVIITVLLMGGLLFVVDILFMLLFSAIDVLQVEQSIVQRLLGSE